MKRTAQKIDPKKFVVEILRESYDGQIYSCIRPEPKACDGNYLVIDRAKGKNMDVKSVKSRATSLAQMLGLPLIEDYTWHCNADRKLSCRCPNCISLGRI